MKLAALTAALWVLVTPLIAAAVVSGSILTWSEAQHAAAYPLYRPSDTDGLRRKTLNVAACMPRRPTIDAVYGAYPSFRSRAPGFGLLEGNVSFCSNSGESTPHGTVKIGDVRATLSVYCPIGAVCPLSSGYLNGYVLAWVRRASRGTPLRMTIIQMDSSHLTLRRFLAIASSVVRVKGS